MNEHAVKGRLNYICIALGLPIFTEDKVEKFKKVFLDRIIKKFAPDCTTDSIIIPLIEEDGVKKSRGVAFIKMERMDQLEALVQGGDHAALDKKTKVRFLKCQNFEEVLAGKGAPDEPAQSKGLPGPQHFSWFLMDSRLRDQLGWLTNGNPVVQWFDQTQAKFEEVAINVKQAEEFGFTPEGAFMVLKRGDKLTFYCGENAAEFGVFSWPKLREWSVSKCGRYLLCKTDDCRHDNVTEPRGAVVYDILMGAQMVKVPVTVYREEGKSNDRKEFDAIGWGLCPDEKGNNGPMLLSFRRCDDNGNGDLIAYVPTGKEREFKPRTLATGVHSFAASHVDGSVFVFKPAAGASPPKIFFIASDTQEQILMSSNYHAVSAQAFWHPNQALCAVSIESDSKKRDSHALIIYDLRDRKKAKSYSPDVDGTILSCAWEPSGLHLAVVVNVAGSNTILVYALQDGVKLLHRFKTPGVNVHWSNQGRYAYAEDIAHGTSTLQFLDLYGRGQLNRIDPTGLLSAEWDPFGVYVMAATKSAIMIYLCDGGSLTKLVANNPKFACWRPRPPFAMTDEKAEEIRKQFGAEVIQGLGKISKIDKKIAEEEANRERAEHYERWMELDRAAERARKNNTSRLGSKPPFEFTIQIEHGTSTDE